MTTKGSRVKKFAILDCEDAEKWRGHENIFINLLKGDNEEWKTFRVWKGELPNLDEQWNGFVVTGSHHSVYDEAQKFWLDPFFHFLRELVNNGKYSKTKIYGGCFGHQALAHGLGGEVGRNPSRKFILKAETLQFNNRFKELPYVKEENVPNELKILESHGDCILKLPPGAEMIACSSTTQIESFIIGMQVLGCQAHPEFNFGHVSEKILPRFAVTQILSKEEQEESRLSCSNYSPLDHQKMIKIISNFLKQM